MNQSHTKDLSIQISLSGLSFCILNRTSNRIEFLTGHKFDKKANHFEILEHLEKTLARHPELSQRFSSVRAIYQNELSNLVPQALFDESNLADYLKFNSKILKTDVVAFDPIAVNASVNVYVPYMNINNFLFDTFGAFEYKHASTILIETVLKEEAPSGNGLIYININPQDFELVAIKDATLQLYNSFEYTSKEDLLYYLLFTMEQLKFNPETAVLKLMGMIAQDDALYTIIYTYVRFVEFHKPSHGFDFEPGLDTGLPHANAILLNSF